GWFLNRIHNSEHEVIRIGGILSPYCHLSSASRDGAGPCPMSAMDLGVYRRVVENLSWHGKNADAPRLCDRYLPDRGGLLAGQSAFCGSHGGRECRASREGGIDDQELV